MGEPGKAQNALAEMCIRDRVYEGVDPSMISIEETEEVETIFREIEAAETKNIYLITLSLIHI